MSTSRERRSVLQSWPQLSSLDRGVHYPVFPAPSCTLSVMTPAEARSGPWKAYLWRLDRTGSNIKMCAGPCLTRSSEDGENEDEPLMGVDNARQNVMAVFSGIRLF